MSATTEVLSIPLSLQKRTKPKKDTGFVVSLLLPAILVFALAILFPIILGVLISFRNSNGVDGYFGNRFTIINYYRLITYGDIYTRNFWRYTYQTLFFSVVSLILEFLLGLMFALVLNKDFKGRGFARAMLLVPWAIPTVASATIYRFEIFNSADQYGLVNSLIQLFGGLPVSFFGSDAPTLFYLPGLIPFGGIITEYPITLTMFTAIIIDVWKTTPFITLLILASLQIVSDDLYKAGDIAGATGWQKFRYITWPLIKPGVGIALIFRMMQAVRVYDAIVVFNDDSIRSLTSYAVILWQNSQFGMASTVSVMLLLIIVIFAFFIILFTQREKRSSKKVRSGRLLRSKNVPITGEGTINQEESMIEENNEYFKSSSVEVDYLVESTQKLKPISKVKVQWFKIRRRLKKVGIGFLAVFLCLFSALPFIWILLRSFRDPYVVQTHFEFFETLSYGLYPVIVIVAVAIFLWIMLRRQEKKRNKIITIVSTTIVGLCALIIPYFFNFPKGLIERITGNPWNFSFGAYQVILENKEVYGVTFGRALLNGFILSGSTVVVVLIVGSLIAYAIAKFDFKFKKPLNGFIFSMNSLPPLIIIIPFYIQIIAVAKIIPFLDIRDKLIGLVLPYAAFNLPLAIFILIAFFREIPEDLWKAAKVDGATNFQIFIRVILPLTIPGIFTCAILVFIASWNELLFAYIFLTSPIHQTIPRAILRFVRNPQSLTADWDTDIALLAATSLATIPLVILVLLFQKKIVSGLTSGAVKG